MFFFRWKQVVFSPKCRVNGHKTTSMSLQERAWQESMKAIPWEDVTLRHTETIPWSWNTKHQNIPFDIICFILYKLFFSNHGLWEWMICQKNPGKNSCSSSQSPRKNQKRIERPFHFGGQKRWNGVSPCHWNGEIIHDDMEIHMESFNWNFAKKRHMTTYSPDWWQVGPDCSFFRFFFRLLRVGDLSKWEVYGWKWWSKRTENLKSYSLKGLNMKSFNCCFGIERILQRDA